MTLNWSLLHSGPITKEEIALYTPQQGWQALRLSLVGTSLRTKYSKLQSWLETNNFNRMSQVQVTNYVNSLKRGGMIE